MNELSTRSEYPRPDFKRDDWMSLNGEWDFWYETAEDMDVESIRSGREETKINVPFAYQSKLSGIGTNEIYDKLWYRKEFNLPSSYIGKRIIIHFGAVDYKASVWVNDVYMGNHFGGHTPFSYDITQCIKKGENIIIVKVEDYSMDMTLPRGKQFWNEESMSIFYTPTTGIWQSVWLESVNDYHLSKVKFTPDIDRNEVLMEAFINRDIEEGNSRIRFSITYKGNDVIRGEFEEEVVEDIYQVKGKLVRRSIVLDNFNHQGFERWWTPENPNLYFVSMELEVDDIVVDKVKTYFGMRKVSIDNGVLCLNNKPYYMKLVLDQGYFPDGNLTASSDEAILRDIKLTKEMGFNGVRKHQKVEDPRFLYWCDIMGLLVWGEMANAYDYSEDYAKKMTSEWADVIERDYNHPSIIAWVPLNESWGIPNVKHDKKQQHHAKAMYHMTKAIDQTRLVMSNDGWEHVESDLLTIHDYEFEPEVLDSRYKDVDSVLKFISAGRSLYEAGQVYRNEPILLTEFGGVSYSLDETQGWGYSSACSVAEFESSIKRILGSVYKSPIIQGYCYTQLTDVEQEINGLLTVNREPKLPIEVINRIITGK